MAAALISALSGRPLRHDLAMTGEITLRGRVLPIGGLKEKVMAAHRARLKTVLLPRRNEKDLVDVPRKVRHDLKLVLVDRMDEILVAGPVTQGRSGRQTETHAHQAQTGAGGAAGSAVPAVEGRPRSK